MEYTGSIGTSKKVTSLSFGSDNGLETDEEEDLDDDEDIISEAEASTLRDWLPSGEKQKSSSNLNSVVFLRWNFGLICTKVDHDELAEIEEIKKMMNAIFTTGSPMEDVGSSLERKKSPLAAKEKIQQNEQPVESGVDFKLDGMEKLR